MNSAKKTTLDAAQLDELAAKVARKQTIDKGAVAEVGGSFIYPVGEGWEASQIKQDAAVLQVNSLSELDEALENTSADTLLVLASSGVSLDLVKAALGRHSQQKTVFIEHRRPAPVE
ncbi:MAG: hypothetical protein FJX23_06260 [Alphaproteobacteria bacterium]|nr:hypothetical protein [Alphaproteobacteria bacterium]